jgi:hypothetical protein
MNHLSIWFSTAGTHGVNALGALRDLFEEQPFHPRAETPE